MYYDQMIKIKNYFADDFFNKKTGVETKRNVKPEIFGSKTNVIPEIFGSKKKTFTYIEDHEIPYQKGTFENF
jgi:hypothetical protein